MGGDAELVKQQLSRKCGGVEVEIATVKLVGEGGARSAEGEQPLRGGGEKDAVAARGIEDVVAGAADGPIDERVNEGWGRVEGAEAFSRRPLAWGVGRSCSPGE